MKTHFKILALMAFLAIGCSPSYVASTAYDDDVYYTPGDAPRIVTLAERSPKKTINQSAKKNDYIPSQPKNTVDNRNFSSIQKRYSDAAKVNTRALGNVTTTYSDTVNTLETAYNEETGYYISGFNGSQHDEEEAAHLRSMYPNGFGYYDNSGYSFAMYIAGDPDWNVYIDGDKVWWTPTWTNHRFYNTFTFSPMRYGRIFAYNYGYNDWYWDFDYGFNFGFNPWYFGFNYGWNSFYPYHPYTYYPYHYYGYAPYYGRYISNRNYHRVSDRYSNRGAGSSRALGRTVRRSNFNTGKSGAAVTATPTRRSHFDNDARRRRANTRYSSRFRNTTSRAASGRSNYSGRRNTSQTKAGRTVNNNRRSNYSTRRTSVPRSYNRTRTVNRPVYNSSKRTNYSTRPVRRTSYSKVKSRTTTSQQKNRNSGNRSSYRRSNSSSRSSYRRSNSSSRSSYTPSRSTRSSNSGVRRSSGSSTTRSGGTRRR